MLDRVYESTFDLHGFEVFSLNPRTRKRVVTPRSVLMDMLLVRAEASYSTEVIREGLLARIPFY